MPRVAVAFIGGGLLPSVAPLLGLGCCARRLREEPEGRTDRGGLPTGTGQSVEWRLHLGGGDRGYWRSSASDADEHATKERLTRRKGR